MLEHDSSKAMADNLATIACMVSPEAASNPRRGLYRLRRLLHSGAAAIPRKTPFGLKYHGHGIEILSAQGLRQPVEPHRHIVKTARRKTRRHRPQARHQDAHHRHAERRPCEIDGK